MPVGEMIFLINHRSYISSYQVKAIYQLSTCTQQRPRASCHLSFAWTNDHFLPEHRWRGEDLTERLDCDHFWKEQFFQDSRSRTLLQIAFLRESVQARWDQLSGHQEFSRLFTCDTAGLFLLPNLSSSLHEEGSRTKFQSPSQEKNRWSSNQILMYEVSSLSHGPELSSTAYALDFSHSSSMEHH
jgi:hypothetical protein